MQGAGQWARKGMGMERVQGEPVVKAPAVTVVVVNYNGGDYLRGCLASLARHTFTDASRHDP